MSPLPFPIMNGLERKVKDVIGCCQMFPRIFIPVILFVDMLIALNHCLASLRNSRMRMSKIIFVCTRIGSEKTAEVEEKIMYAISAHFFKFFFESHHVVESSQALMFY